MKIIIYSFIIKKIFQTPDVENTHDFEKIMKRNITGIILSLCLLKKTISFTLLARVVSRNSNFDRSRRSKIRRRQNDPKSRVRKMGARGNRLIARHTRGEQLIRLTRHTVNRIKACPGPSKLGRGDENGGKTSLERDECTLDSNCFIAK